MHWVQTFNSHVQLRWCTEMVVAGIWRLDADSFRSPLLPLISKRIEKICIFYRGRLRHHRDEGNTTIISPVNLNAPANLQERADIWHRKGAAKLNWSYRESRQQKAIKSTIGEKTVHKKVWVYLNGKTKKKTLTENPILPKSPFQHGKLFAEVEIQGNHLCHSTWDPQTGSLTKSITEE